MLQILMDSREYFDFFSPDLQTVTIDNSKIEFVLIREIRGKKKRLSLLRQPLKLHFYFYFRETLKTFKFIVAMFA